MSPEPTTRAPRSAAKARLVWALRLAVSAIILTVIFRFVPLAQVWEEARQIPPLLWLGALAAFLAGHAASAAKWRLLIGPGVAFPQAFRAHLAGLGANLCLPGVAGGDVVRAGMVISQAKDRSRLAVGSLADRLLDTLGLVLITGVGAAMAVTWDAHERWALLGAAAGASVMVAGFFAGAGWLAPRFAPDKAKHKVMRLAGQALGAAAGLAREPGRLALCLAISLGVQSLFVMINIAFAWACQVQAPAAAWFFSWSAAKLVAILPISLGGLGVREAGMAALMKPFGAEPAQVIAVGLIWQTLLYTSGLIGLVVQAAWRPAGARPATPPPADAAAGRTP